VLDILTIDSIRDAARRIAPYVLRTPLLEHVTASGARLFLKPELLQPIGAFKLRGAFSLMLTLPKDCPGVVAHSSGNHAQAVARAAKTLGLRAVIVMPSDAPELKRRRTAADGAEIVTVGTDSDERVRVADEIARTRGMVPVPPYDHPLIAAGQGTLALEMIEDLARAGVRMDKFFCPVSGGGLMAGCAVALAALSPETEIVGVEPADGDDTKRSLAAGERVKVPPPRTLADGLRVRTPGERTFPVLKKHVRRIELVTDDELLSAMQYALGELRVVVEPSGAASLAVALREGGAAAGVVLSGGNADPALVARVAAPPS
jgi:threo-3-hydroxy-L-aspartate ammonia-lyase